MEAKHSSPPSSPPSAKHSSPPADAKGLALGVSADRSSPPPTVTIQHTDCQPDDNCPVTAGLRLEIDFELSAPLKGASWEVRYLVDSMVRRHVIVLGETRERLYAEGDNSMSFEVPEIDVSEVRRGALANAGLLSAELRDGGGREVFTLNYVVQVRPEGEGFVRTIYNPLE